MTSQTNAKALGIQRSILKGAFHKVFEGAPVTRPVGFLDTFCCNVEYAACCACTVVRGVLKTMELNFLDLLNHLDWPHLN